MTVKQLEKELSTLPVTERLRIARWLLDTVLAPASNDSASENNPLLNIAGRFHGGPGDSADRIEEILSNDLCRLGLLGDLSSQFVGRQQCQQ